MISASSLGRSSPDRLRSSHTKNPKDGQGQWFHASTRWMYSSEVMFGKQGSDWRLTTSSKWEFVSEAGILLHLSRSSRKAGLEGRGERGS